MAACLALAAFLGFRVAHADPITLTIDTPLLSGMGAIFAFDLIDGGPPMNSVTITGFASNGSLGSISTMGDVTGTLSGVLTIGDSSFFNEYAQGIVLGSIISFTFEATNNVADPESFPDAFSFFLLDPGTGLSLVTTSDLTGANALFLYSIGVPNPLEVYESSEVRVVVVKAVPEPGGLSLVVGGLLALAAMRRARRKRNAHVPVPFRGSALYARSY